MSPAVLLERTRETSGKITNSILFARKKLVAFACKPLGTEQQFFLLRIESNFCLRLYLYVWRSRKYLRISNVAHICSVLLMPRARPIPERVLQNFSLSNKNRITRSE
jgi:hypothetical protein